MLDTVITHVDEVTPAWLTQTLLKSGALEKGAVASFDVNTDERLLSTSVRLKLTYTSDSQGSMPQKLFLKIVNTDQEDEFFGASEVNYYMRDYVGVKDVPLVRTYHAVYSESLGRYHILMDDVRDTHVEAASKTPTLEHGFALAEGLAAMHTHWWGMSRLAEIGASLHTAEHIMHFVDIARPGAGHIIAAVGEQLKPHWIEMIHEFYEKHPSLMIARTQDDNGFTLIHGDTNLLNILVPIEGERPIYIIDRQPFDWSLTAWLGVYDLAYTMVLKWDAEIRRELEQPILRHYHERLMKLGIQNYSWEQLWQDYQLCVAMGVYIATEWCRGQFYPDTLRFWMPMLQRSLTAIDDLECFNLWRKS
jgi:hypothetical protein